jgi:hypothetical protein
MSSWKCRGNDEKNIPNRDSSGKSTFRTSLPHEHIELFEQPFKEGNWEDMKRLAKISPIPLMLDESIYDMNDIEKVIQLECADYIKLKLMNSSWERWYNGAYTIGGDTHNSVTSPFTSDIR